MDNDIQTFVGFIFNPNIVETEKESINPKITTVSSVMMHNNSLVFEKQQQNESSNYIPVIITVDKSKKKRASTRKHTDISSYALEVTNIEQLEKFLEDKKYFFEKYNPLNTPKKVRNTEHPLLVKSREIILKHLSNEEYNVDSFSRDIGLSRTRLYCKFKEVSKISVSAFIRKVRLEKAEELFSEGKLSVKQVAAEVGFADVSYFRKCFKQQYGVSPSIYIKRIYETYFP